MDIKVVPIRGEADIVNACMQARHLANEHRMSKVEVARFVTMVSELAWNIVKYAGTGTCLFSISDANDQLTMTATFEDYGPGIANIEMAMRDGFTTGSGLGGGLPGSKRLADTFHIHSEPGHTVVTVGLVVGEKRRA